MYEKQIWSDVYGETPFTSERMNHIEDGIYNASNVYNITKPNTSLNDYVETGIYFFYNSDVTPTDIPEGTNGWLVVLKGKTGVLKQIWYRFGSAGNHFRSFIRTRFNDDLGWSNWQRLITENDMYYKNGDTVVIDYHTVGGSVTGGSKDLQFSIVLPKSLKNIKSFTINSLQATARGVNGYITGLNGNAIKVSDSDISYSNSAIASENILNVRLARNDVYGNVVNNTPVALALTNVSITLYE